MPRRHAPRLLTQLDLFRARPTTPDWDRLPADVRFKTVPLLARLLNDYRRTRIAADQSREVGDE